MPGVEPATALFPPQKRDWSLPAEVPLSPRAARRVAREAALHPFDKAAAAINDDWGVGLDGKQIQRWSEALGESLVLNRQSEVESYERGQRPESPANPPELLVIGMDGGRVQTREVNPETGSRWRENKVAAVTSYLPGDAGAAQPPKPLVTTYTATMQKAEPFGKMVLLEAERRGLRQAGTVLVMGDGGNWIDPLNERARLGDQRVIDFYHATEHLYASAQAALGKGSPPAKALAKQLKRKLWKGKVKQVIAALQQHVDRLGPPQEQDGPEHPRRVLANDVDYFRRHQCHMQYAKYRRRGWPIGSGVAESGVKLFNKRVKGTEQFWNHQGAESVMALRALWLSQDERWHRYWRQRPAYRKAA